MCSALTERMQRVPSAFELVRGYSRRAIVQLTDVVDTCSRATQTSLTRHILAAAVCALCQRLLRLHWCLLSRACSAPELLRCFVALAADCLPFERQLDLRCPTRRILRVVRR